MELLIDSVSTQCLDDQGEYAKFSCTRHFEKTILGATCATGFVVCVVQSRLYIENVLAISVAYGKENVFVTPRESCYSNPMPNDAMKS